jgi:hypothetical protein
MVNIVMAFKISIARLLPYLNMRESSSPPPQSNSTSDVCDEIELIQKIFVLMHYDRPKEMRPNELSYPRQSRGFISVSPSKGQKHEAPEGADSRT